MSICTKFKTFTFFTDGKHMPVRWSHDLNMLSLLDGFTFQSLISGAILEQGSCPIHVSVSCWSKSWTCIFVSKVGNLLFIRLNRSFWSVDLLWCWNSVASPRVLMTYVPSRVCTTVWMRDFLQEYTIRFYSNGRGLMALMLQQKSYAYLSAQKINIPIDTIRHDSVWLSGIID